jgi:serine/threonine protein phosphatase PrpC
VYDGHGQHGEYVSEYASFTFVDLMEEDIDNLKADPRAAMRKNMLVTDQLIRKQRGVPSMESGSTAIFSLLWPHVIYTGCVGDSRAVKATQKSGSERWTAFDLSVDQKPDDPVERKRIETLGGFVSEASEVAGPARVWRGSYGIGPGLAMGRSLGDHAVADIGVSAEAEVTESPIDPEDRCIILASDGVWEFITSQEAVNIVFAHKDNATAACKALIKESAKRWKDEEGNYRDDITAIVIFLPVFEHLTSTDYNTGGKGTNMFDAEGARRDREEVSFKSSETHERDRESERQSRLSRTEPPKGTLEDSSPAQFVRRRLSVGDQQAMMDAAGASTTVLERSVIEEGE